MLMVTSNNIILRSLAIVLMLLTTSAQCRPRHFTLEQRKLRKIIGTLNTQIHSATANKARLQRERDILLRQFKEISSNRKMEGQSPSILATPEY